MAGIGIASSTSPLFSQYIETSGFRVGIIGLDTSHSIEFTKILNNPAAGDSFNGYKVVAAYPQGSLDIKSSVVRITGYTEWMKLMGIEIVDSIDNLLKKVDVVLLETNDGRRHLEQALPVLKAGKRMFIDKPIAASLSDAMILFNASKHFNVPIFTSSSCRYMEGMDNIKSGSVGKVLGTEAFSPAPIEKTHPDLFWYGIHGVEILFTAMGTGCKKAIRVSTADTDVVVGIWQDDRIGTFRGSRSGVWDSGAEIFGEKENRFLNSNKDSTQDPDFEYAALLQSVVRFFKTGINPVPSNETFEILAFMEAADESKKSGGFITIEEIMKRAEEKSRNYQF